MIVTAWNNGKHLPSGAGYGLKISVEDRDKHFDRNWTSVVLEFDSELQPVSVNINKSSFWNPYCRELISKHIGSWFIKNGRAPWTKGTPPKLIMEHLDGNRFKVKLK